MPILATIDPSSDLNVVLLRVHDDMNRLDESFGQDLGLENPWHVELGVMSPPYIGGNSSSDPK